MSEIITFYSYKGGVGRTMALANVSVLLSEWGHKVLVLDWDLEAPGLEHFFKDYIDIKVVETTPGIIDLLQMKESTKWQDSIISVNTHQSKVPIHFISSGKRDEDYFKKVRSFNVDTFYENNGGHIIEQLRNEWLANYDYVLVDSRTGITEIGGICTIQLPDTIVMLFTATDQGFDGALDIIKRASAAQQKLSYDRQKLVFLPIPSKFETNTEFKLSQEWLVKFAEKLESTYNDWLPSIIDRKEFLELTKIPYISYFSFGEKLPIIEQGVRDPSGLGYAYETLAVLIANRLTNVDLLPNNRDSYISRVNKFPSIEIETKRNSTIERKLNTLKQKLNINSESINFEKNKDTVIECIQNSIEPLLESISDEMKKIGSLFKNKNEELTINGTYISGFDEKLFVFTITEQVKNLAGRAAFLYSPKSSLEKVSINTLEYSFNFRSLRKISKFNVELPIKIHVVFHDTVFEISSDIPQIYIDKLYHERISTVEIQHITDTLTNTILEKIEAATTD